MLEKAAEFVFKLQLCLVDNSGSFTFYFSVSQMKVDCVGQAYGRIFCISSKLKMLTEQFEYLNMYLQLWHDA